MNNVSSMDIKKAVHRGIVISNREIVTDYYIMNIQIPSSFPEALPGQFVMVRTLETDTPLLSRPFSIHSQSIADKSRNIEILYRVVGKGTKVMSHLRTGNSLSVLGPLGHGYDIQRHHRKVAIVAGGIGIAPLAYLVEYYRRGFQGGDRIIAGYYGGTSERVLVGIDRLEKVCDTIKIATEDGSRGHTGVVTDLLQKDLRSFEGEGGIVCACGPIGMMKALAELMKERDVVCQVSMEERMACGVGACLGCSIKAKTDANGPAFFRTCKEGPVFNIGEIDWDAH